MKKINTILFDFDGTLADSNELISESHFRVVDEYFPGRFQRDNMQSFNGPSLVDIYTHLDNERKEEMMEKYRNHMMSMHDDTIKMFPGIKEMLEVIHEKGIKVGIVSAKRKDILEQGVQVLGIAPYVDVVIGFGDYQNSKPNPESVLLALEKLNSSADTAMMVGDNFHDIEAGNSAGTQSVFVEWSEKSVESILPYEPTFIVSNVKELEKLILEYQS
ncbi:pyrophosphatase PpaX [Jeotgalibaca sp. MA1X17-3]|uniref:pyrophosphatase PpaX n=1 Tax=Jeotgalibaca sp. MA1X17-3 TaxID=2908211 RepID=UPI001F350CF8|nr:pyrophosphatase PpaX [Jeotgalibaca sp. MA1X17-3]UJF15489.1 pyrophosphatase PpaX [Jeotgalibaca sp. MA1X17-3]